MKVRFLVFLVLSVAAAASAAKPQVTLHVTGAVEGDIVIELYPEKAPITVVNFLDYVRTGFYNGLLFHRVKEDFMIQGGGYDTSMNKKDTDPPIINESTNDLSNLLGTIAMARGPYPHSATSEFFINHIDNLFLDSGQVNYYTYFDEDEIEWPVYYYTVGYCVFGRVISGMSVVNAIAAVETEIIGGPGDERPDADIIIETATVTLEAPACTEKLEGDFDGDCDMDADDIMKFAIQWLHPTCQGCYSADVNDDGEVNFADFVRIANNWLKCNSITAPCE